MTNREYFEKVISSNLDDEAKGYALSVITNSNNNSIYLATEKDASNYSFGIDSKKVNFSKVLLCTIFQYLMDNEEARCKDIADAYNAQFPDCGGYPNRKVDYRNVRNAMNLLVQSGILGKTFRDAKVTCVTRDYVNGKLVDLTKDIVVQIPYYSLNI